MCCEGPIDSTEMHVKEKARSFAWRQALPVCWEWQWLHEKEDQQQNTSLNPCLESFHTSNPIRHQRLISVIFLHLFSHKVCWTLTSGVLACPPPPPPSSPFFPPSSWILRGETRQDWHTFPNSDMLTRSRAKIRHPKQSWSAFSLYTPRLY